MTTRVSLGDSVVVSELAGEWRVIAFRAPHGVIMIDVEQCGVTRSVSARRVVIVNGEQTIHALNPFA